MGTRAQGLRARAGKAARPRRAEWRTSRPCPSAPATSSCSCGECARPCVELRAISFACRVQPHDFVFPLRRFGPDATTSFPQSQRHNHCDTLLTVGNCRRTNNCPNVKPCISFFMRITSAVRLSVSWYVSVLPPQSRVSARVHIRSFDRCRLSPSTRIEGIARVRSRQRDSNPCFRDTSPAL